MWKLFSILLILSICIAFSSELCSFNIGTCEWNIEAPWNLVTIARLPIDNRNGVQTILSDGPFLLAQGKFGSTSTGKSTSQPISPSKHMRILAYRFQRRGSATLRLSLLNSTNELLLLDTIGQTEPETFVWSRRSVLIPPIDNVTSARIEFQCDHIRTSNDVISIDDVDLATPANVMWSGQDSTFFDENEIRQRDIRRSITRKTDICEPIKCVFHSTICKWKSTNFQTLPSKIVNEADGDSILTSDPIEINDENANLQIEMFDSDGSQTTISIKSTIAGAFETIIWRKKFIAANGWKRVLVSLKEHRTNNPIIIIIRCSNAENQFCAFKSIDLVDNQRKSIKCEPSKIASSPIQPHSDDPMIRLTALQNLKITPIEKLLYSPPVTIHAPPPPAPPPQFLFNRDEGGGGGGGAVLPIAPAQVFQSQIFFVTQKPSTSILVAGVSERRSNCSDCGAVAAASASSHFYDVVATTSAKKSILLIFFLCVSSRKYPVFI